MTEKDAAAAPAQTEPKKAKGAAKGAGRGRPKGPPKPPKEPGQRGRPKQPKRDHAPFKALVKDAIKALSEKKGSSKIAIVKYVMENEKECADKAYADRGVKTALKRLLTEGVLVAPKGPVGKFKLADGAKKGSPKKRGRPATSDESKPKKVAKSPKKAKKVASPKKAATKPKKAAKSPAKKAAKKSPAKKAAKKTPKKAAAKK